MSVATQRPVVRRQEFHNGGRPGKITKLGKSLKHVVLLKHPHLPLNTKAKKITLKYFLFIYSFVDKTMVTRYKIQESLLIPLGEILFHAHIKEYT